MRFIVRVAYSEWSLVGNPSFGGCGCRRRGDESTPPATLPAAYQSRTTDHPTDEGVALRLEHELILIRDVVRVVRYGHYIEAVLRIRRVREPAPVGGPRAAGILVKMGTCPEGLQILRRWEGVRPVHARTGQLTGSCRGDLPTCERIWPPR